MSVRPPIKSSKKTSCRRLRRQDTERCRVGRVRPGQHVGGHDRRPSGTGAADEDEHGVAVVIERDGWDGGGDASWFLKVNQSTARRENHKPLSGQAAHLEL